MSTDDHKDDRQSDLAVMGANEYKNKHRLRQILDAHDNVENVKAEADMEHVAGHISDTGKRLVILWAVQRHIREIYNLLLDYMMDLDDDEDDQYFDDNPGDRPLGRIERKTDTDIEFQGLRDILEAKDTYTESYRDTVESRHGPDLQNTVTETYTVPVEVSLRAYLLAKQFMKKEHDLDIQFEDLDDSLPTWGFEEVPEEDGTEQASDDYDPSVNYGPGYPKEETDTDAEVADGDD